MSEPDHQTLAKLKRAKAAARTKSQTRTQPLAIPPTNPRHAKPNGPTNPEHVAEQKSTTTKLHQSGGNGVAAAKRLKNQEKVEAERNETEAESKLLRRGLARFEARLHAPGGVSALAGAIRRYARRPDLAALVPDETIAGMVLAQVKGAMAPGSFGTADRAAFWRLLDAPWSHPSGSKGAGGLSPEDAADMGRTIQDRVSAAIERAERAGRLQAGRSGLGRGGVTLDVVVDGEDGDGFDPPPPPSRAASRAISGHVATNDQIVKPVGGVGVGGRAASGHSPSGDQIVSPFGGDDQQRPDPAALRRQFLAARDAAAARTEGDRASLSWLDDRPTPPDPAPTTPQGDGRRMRPARRRAVTDDGQEAAPSDPSWPR